MKIYKENLLNQLLHPRQLRRQRRKAVTVAGRITVADELLISLAKCNSLLKMVELHKKIWEQGFRNGNIAPCEWGMFRTKDIMTMKPSEVYLGDIYGLWTFTVPEWESKRNAMLGSNPYGINPGITVYQIVLDQYRRHLKSNLEALVSLDRRWQKDYIAVNGTAG